MLKVHILSNCSHCNGEAYLSIGEAKDHTGRKYTRHAPYPICEGSDNQPTWINLTELVAMLNQVQCPREHTSFQGSMVFITGDVRGDATQRGAGRVYRLLLLPLVGE
jgi:hypothetical protein